MRVLMLGWEFPPHISGGLGKACYGLTQGLREHDVLVDFVVPRLFGDEDQRYVDLLSCESTLRARAPKRVASTSASTPQTSQPTTDSQVVATATETETGPTVTRTSHTKRWFVEHVDEHLTQISVDSPLHPYLDATTYAQRVRLTSQFERSSAVFSDTLSHPPVFATALAQDSRAPQAHEVLPEHTDAPGEAPLFSGKYGRDLIIEVYRYASAVEEIALQPWKIDRIGHRHDRQDLVL